ncbi:DUF2971 domain-containing protein [Aeromonas veronii]|uniref:DUF2971 domain-containing protein n=1 Tax=Aeromonas veronii TaxID=654 RepID=UPI003B9F15B1
MAPPSRLEGFREGRGWGRIPPVLLHGGETLKGGDSMTIVKNDDEDVLYKYSGWLEFDYFKSPTLKLSIIEKLNDPFEYKHSDDIESVIQIFLKKIGFDDICASEFTAFFGLTIDSNGIISFSETPRNHLMWAHYANNHKGICIGYKSNLLNKVSVDTKKRAFHINLSKPEKIKYDNNRITPEDKAIKEIAIKKSIDENADSIYRDLAKRQLLKKSDEWIYEKEHRIILPYTVSNKIKFNLNDDDDDDDYNTINTIQWLEKSNKIRPTQKKDTYEIINMTEGELHHIKEREDASFLIDINIEDIVSVYMGCKVSKEITKKLLKAFKDDNLDIDVYVSKISKTRFEIEHHLITLDNFDSIYDA